MSRVDRPQPETLPGIGSSGVALRVLIVDDNADFRRLARALLEHGGYAVVGEVGDGTSAVAACEALRPAMSCSIFSSLTWTALRLLTVSGNRCA